MSGLLRTDEVSDAAGFPVPPGDYETLAGLVLARLGRIPDVGDDLVVDGWRLTVVRRDRNRVAELRLARRRDPGTGNAAPRSATRGNDLLALLSAVLLLAGNAFFVGAEFALISARRDRLETLAAGTGRTALAARTVLRATGACRRCSPRPSSRSPCSRCCSAASASPRCARLLERPMSLVGPAPDVVPPIALVVALLLVVVAHMLLGEMVPSNIALAGPERAAMVLVPPFLLFTTAVSPAVGAVQPVRARWCSGCCGVQPRDELDDRVHLRRARRHDRGVAPRGPARRRRVRPAHPHPAGRGRHGGRRPRAPRRTGVPAAAAAASAT